MTNLEITNAYIGDIEAIRLYLGDNLVYGTEPEPEEDPMLRTPLTFEFIEQGTGTTHGIGLRLTGVTSTDERDQYRHPLMYVLTHNGEKTTGYLDLTEDVSSSAVTSLMTGLTLGDTVEFYAKEKQGALGSTVDIYEYFVLYEGGDKYAVYGNVNSLLVTKDEFDDFDNATFIASAYTFHGLFSGKTNCDFGAPSSEKHILLAEPTNGLQDSCYRSMFRATKITDVPELPATTLAPSCYRLMFYGCSSLTTAPELPATTLADNCYNSMFYNCRSLTTAPALPATTLAYACYSTMFYNCTSLTTAPELPAMTLSYVCYNGMFYGCSSLTTAPELPATTLADNCYNSMFYGCSSLTAAPELPAATLMPSCYNGMFYGCSSLTTAPELPATTLADNCYNSMFYNCRSLTTAPALPATTLASECYGYMFFNCTSLTTAPELPATTLVDGCYSYMFYNCRKLDILDCRATDITASACTTGWVSYVASSGTFVKDPNMTSWTRGTNGIPTNWTVIDAVGIQLPETYKKVWEDESGVKTITILPFEDWTASTSDDWITFDKAIGTSEDRTFSFNYTSTNEPRTGTITFTSNSNSVTFTLYQNDLNNRLTFNILSDGRITWKKTETAAVSGWNVSLYYRKNDAASWSTLNISSGGTSINVSAGDTLEFAANGTSQTLATGTTMYCWLGDSTAQFEARGNIMSLLSTNDYSGATTLESAYTFYGLFSGCTALTSAEKLILPATTLAQRCYEGMFRGCINLTKAPKTLPAGTLTSYSYYYMFYNCTSLTTAPEILATSYGSSSSRSCRNMFQGCSNLNYIKCMFHTAPSSSSALTNPAYYWVAGVASTGTFVRYPGVNWPNGDSGIPNGWTVVDSVE